MCSKYSNGKIYKIINNETNEIYIGSTVLSLKKRFDKHKYSYKYYLKGKYNYTTSFELFKNDGLKNCKIEMIELYPCENKKELEKKEGEYIKLNKTVNKNIVGRTKKESKKIYRENNKEKINQKNICYCGGQYINNNKARHLKSKKHINYNKLQEEITIKKTKIDLLEKEIDILEK